MKQNTKRKAYVLGLSLAISCSVGAQTSMGLSCMDSITQTLPTIMVRGAAPIAQIKGATISYDLQRLLQERGADNAWEAVKLLPGVIETNSTLQLLGQDVSFAIDGQVSSLSLTQVAQQLKSMPASSIERVDVMYASPAQYQVHGRLINLVLKRSEDLSKTFSGELNLAYHQDHDALFGERVAGRYHKGKFSLDAFYLHSHGLLFGFENETLGYRTAAGSLPAIMSNEDTHAHVFAHTYQLGAAYQFATNNQLSFAYQGNYNHQKFERNFAGYTLGNDRLKYRPWLHDVRLDYQAPFGLKVGVEGTWFRSPVDQFFVAKALSGTLYEGIESKMNVQSWRFYAQQTHTLSRGWQLHYGAWLKTTHDEVNHAMAMKLSPPSRLYGEDYHHDGQETLVNAYAGFSKRFSEQLNVDASLAAEYYHLPRLDAINDWRPLPTLNITYMPHANHMWLLSLSSSLQYPDYWAMQPIIMPTRGNFNLLMGNADLHPATSYQTQLTYLLKQRYQFTAWYTYTDECIMRQASVNLSPAESVLLLPVNLEYREQAGLQAVIPQKVGQMIDSRLTLMGIWQRDFNHAVRYVAFNRVALYGVAALKNVVTLSTLHHLALTLDASVQTKTKQGTWDIPATGSVDVGVNWDFWKQRARLHAFANDLFCTAVAHPRFQQHGYSLHFDRSCYRQFGVSLTIKLGDYAEKQQPAADISRLQRGL